MQFAIKKKSAIFWKTSYTHEEMKDFFAKLGSADDWEVCPLGEADKAVPVNDYMKNPHMWDNVYKSSPNVEHPPLGPGEKLIRPKNLFRGC